MDGHEHYLTRTPRANTKIQKKTQNEDEEKQVQCLLFGISVSLFGMPEKADGRTDGRQEKLLNVIKLIALKSLW